MLKRLWGVANSYVLTFALAHTYDDSSQWIANVPKDLSDGEYTVQIWAEDFAGNSTYYANLFFTIDAGKLCFCFEKINYKTDILPEKYNTEVTIKDYKTEKMPDTYQSVVLDAPFKFEVIRRCECG